MANSYFRYSNKDKNADEQWTCFAFDGFSEIHYTPPNSGALHMRVIAKSSLVKFWSQPWATDSQSALQSWHDEAQKASWQTPQNIKDSTAVPASVATTGWFLTLLATSTGWLLRCNTKPELRG